MDDMLTINAAGPCQTTYGTADEDANKATLDQVLAECALWRVYREIVGMYVQPRPTAEEKQPRIDYLLTPERKLLDLGWRHGAIGIEAKAGGKKLGPVVCQALDYARAAWELPGSGVVVLTPMVFIWPVGCVVGDLDSVACQHNIGWAHSYRPHLLFKLKLGGSNILTVSGDGIVEIKTVKSGKRAGSR